MEREYIDSLPADAIDELHLGGFTPETEESNPGSELWIDTHAAPLTDAAWDLHGYALGRFGRKPTLIEWDSDIPALETLLGEVQRTEDAMTANESEYVRAR